MTSFGCNYPGTTGYSVIAAHYQNYTMAIYTHHVGDTGFEAFWKEFRRSCPYRSPTAFYIPVGPDEYVTEIAKCWVGKNQRGLRVRAHDSYSCPTCEC